MPPFAFYEIFSSIDDAIKEINNHKNIDIAEKLNVRKIPLTLENYKIFINNVFVYPLLWCQITH